MLRNFYDTGKALLWPGPKILGTRAVQVLQTALTGPIATGPALVVIDVGGLMVAFGKGTNSHPIHRLNRVNNVPSAPTPKL